MPKGRVLAVDDQRYFRTMIEGLLIEEGFDAHTVSTGEEALRLLDQGRFDVVMTDLVMPAMDGSELVRRIKERDPDQDVVVVTGVVDVKTAVDAMKLGANDYLIKPFDRATLSASLDNILRQRRLRDEHERLLAENIEYLGERSLFERAIALFSAGSLPELAERTVEALCLETQAQGGVLWLTDVEDPVRLRLVCARGLVRMDTESEVLGPEDWPGGLADSAARSAMDSWGSGTGTHAALYVPLRREDRVIGLARLSDKLGGGEFDPVDRSCAEKIARFGEMAVATALRIRGLERRSLHNPATGAYVVEYFEDLTRKEIEKAHRSGRGFSILKVDLGSLAARRRQHGEAAVTRGLSGMVALLRDLTRTGDLVAGDGESVFYVLFTESDAVGAAVLKQRLRRAMARDPLFGRAADLAASDAHVGVVTFPADGAQLETLMKALDERVKSEAHSPVSLFALDRLSAADALGRLLAEGEPERPRIAEQIAHFVFAEVARRPRDRGLLFVGPGAAFSQVVAAGLDGLRGSEFETEIAVVSRDPRPPLDPSIVWTPPPENIDYPPFVARFGDGPAYLLVRDEKAEPDGARLYHSDDRGLVEHLIFKLQIDLGLERLGDFMTQLVLIADPLEERGKRIEESCVARGLRCTLAPNGAAALEAALLQVPLALAAHVDLPVISGVKLAEILEANPHTQSIRTLLLTDVNGSEGDAFGDRAVAVAEDPDAVARSVEALIANGSSPGTHAISEGDGGVEGELAQLPLADLLQLFHVGRKTGVVEVVQHAHRGGGAGRIYLRGGDVIQALVGFVEGEKALFRLLAWERGSFSFRPGPVSLPAVIEAPSRALLREGQRQLREWDQQARVLLPLDARVRLVVDREQLPSGIHPISQEVLVLLDAYSRVRDVVDHSRYPDYQVLRTLQTLVSRRMLEVQRAPAFDERSGGEVLFSPNRIARLREWTAHSHSRGMAPEDAKLLVLPPDPESCAELAGLLRQLPGIELTADEPGGSLPGRDDLVRMGRLAVDAEIGIELVHVPADERFAPVWPLVGHGALGVIVPLTATSDAVVETVLRATTTLGGLPNARIHHLLLLSGSERGATAALRENPSLLEDGSFFLVPLANRDKAVVLLREMFGRILP